MQKKQRFISERAKWLLFGVFLVIAPTSITVFCKSLFVFLEKGDWIWVDFNDGYFQESLLLVYTISINGIILYIDKNYATDGGIRFRKSLLLFGLGLLAGPVYYYAKGAGNVINNSEVPMIVISVYIIVVAITGYVIAGDERNKKVAK